MKKIKKNTVKMLPSLITFIILSFIGVFVYQMQKVKDYLTIETTLCLQASIKNIIEHKAKNSYYRTEYEYDPNKRKIGEYETRTARYADTIFEYRSRIVAPGENAFRGFQTAFLETNQLHPDSIHFFFDRLLKEKNIHVTSIVGITASFYTTKNEWSGDTTAIDINYRTAFINQGDYEDINYYAYIHYSPFTLWTLMPKKTVCTLLILSIIIGVILLWWLHKRKKEKKNEITSLKNGNYRIRNIEFSAKEKTLIPEESEKEIILSKQLNDLLLLFLKADNHKVSKEEIKQKFWPKSISSATNMTSTVNRLNKILKGANCAYTIITDPKGEEYYIFLCESIKKEEESSVSSLLPLASS